MQAQTSETHAAATITEKPGSGNDYRAKYYQERMMSEQLAKKVRDMDGLVTKTQEENKKLKEQTEALLQQLGYFQNTLQTIETELQETKDLE